MLTDVERRLATVSDGWNLESSCVADTHICHLIGRSVSVALEAWQCLDDASGIS
jgi:hypothetical protein